MTNPTRFIPPWATDFTNEANNAWAVVGDVVGDVTGGAVTLPPSSIPSTNPVLPAPVPPTTTTVTAGPVGPGLAPAPAAPITNLSGLETVLGPVLKADVEAYAQQYLAAVLAGKQPAALPSVTYDGQSLTHQAASAHAWRTFLIGMSTTAISAILDAIGQQANVDFFSKQGLVATATLAVGTLVSTVTSYIARLKITPDYEAKLLAAPPGVVKK